MKQVDVNVNIDIVMRCGKSGEGVIEGELLCSLYQADAHLAARRKQGVRVEAGFAVRFEISYLSSKALVLVVSESRPSRGQAAGHWPRSQGWQ